MSARPAAEVDKQQLIGVDVGGTNIRLARVDEKGRISARRQMQAEFSTLCAADAASRVVETLQSLIHPRLTQQRIAAVGIGFPGFFDTEGSLLLSSPNIPGLTDAPLAEHLSAKLGVPVFMQNDAALAALGEFRFGAGRGAHALLHLTLGTGIGGGLVLGDRIYTGDGGMALEIGHMQIGHMEPGATRTGQPHIVPDERRCGCGHIGCLETFASAAAVASRYSQASGRQTNAHDVCRLAEQGDATAGRIIREAGECLGRAIAEAVKLLDVRLVTISGGLSNAWPLLHPPLRDALDQFVLPPQQGKIEVRRSELDDDAGILGAAAFALDGLAR